MSEHSDIAAILCRQKGRARFLEGCKFRADQTRAICRQIAGTLELKSVSKLVPIKPNTIGDFVYEVQFQWYVGARKPHATPDVSNVLLTIRRLGINA